MNEPQDAGEIALAHALGSGFTHASTLGEPGGRHRYLSAPTTKAIRLRLRRGVVPDPRRRSMHGGALDTASIMV